jgi:siderophore synthetase component
MDSLVLGSPVDLAEEAALAALLRCCVREVAGPRGQVWPAEPYVLCRVAGTLIRARAHGGLALRFEGRPEWLCDGAWRPLGADLLTELVAAELGGHNLYGHNLGGHNEEFAVQVANGREAIAIMLKEREQAAPPADPWLASEQSLVFGHPFHPSPKARGGSDWLGYAPEAHAAFPLRLLAVREDLVAAEGDASALDRLGSAPGGYALLPAHPWQLSLLAADLAGPLADGRLIDLGPAARPVTPTSSVRTVYDPGIERCLKFSLDVRITNCVRKNAWYELAGAVELTRRLAPVFDELAEAFPGTRWLPEPGYRSLSAGPRLLEGLAVIVRAGPWAVCGPGVTPLLAGALALPADGPVGVPEAVELARRADPPAWWAAYVERVALPVLDAYFRHGVVLEPHLQNVLVGVDPAGVPVQAVFRDLEGTKLVAGRHDLSRLPPAVADALVYEAERGWNRVVYCLVVNHLAEIAATVAEGAGAHARAGLLRDLWAVARRRLSTYAESAAAPLPLSDLLAGVPLPAKANLSVRWSRSADRTAGYVPVANPFAGAAGREEARS